MSTRLLTINALTAFIYVSLFALQAQAMDGNQFWASLVFLPHGWRVLSFFLFRFSAMPGLFVGHLATCFIFFGSIEENWPLYVITSLQGTYTLPFLYLALRALGLDLLATRKEYAVVPWTSFVGLTVLATLFNGVLVAIAGALYFDQPMNWEQVRQYMVGDMIGALLCITGLLLFFRWQRLRTDQKRIAD